LHAAQPPHRKKNQRIFDIGGEATGKGEPIFCVRRRRMPGFLKATAIVGISGAAIGAGVLAILPPAPMDLLPTRSNFATVRVSDLPPAPCGQQLWPNTDRGCQSWTMPRHDVAALLAAKAGTAQQKSGSDNTTIVAHYRAPVAPQRAADPAADMVLSDATASVASDPSDPPIVGPREDAIASKPETATAPLAVMTWVAHGETVEKAKIRALLAREARTSGVHVARTAADRNAIPVVAPSTAGTQRVIMIRPTSRQDELYYSARRYQAADNSAVMHR
jgi:hypothetical protein